MSPEEDVMAISSAMVMSRTLIEMLREERGRGFKNDVVPGGIDTLLQEYISVIPLDVAMRMRAYPASDNLSRRKIISEVGPRLSREYSDTYGQKPELAENLKSILHDYLDVWREIAEITQAADQRDRTQQLSERGHSKYDMPSQRVVTPPSSAWSIKSARLHALRNVLHGKAEASTLDDFATSATSPLATGAAPHVELHARHTRAYPGAMSGGSMYAKGYATERVPILFERDGLDLEARIDFAEIERMEHAPSPGDVTKVKIQIESINERKKAYGYQGELDNAVAKLIGVHPEWQRISQGD